MLIYWRVSHQKKLKSPWLHGCFNGKSWSNDWIWLDDWGVPPWLRKPINKPSPSFSNIQMSDWLSFIKIIKNLQIIQSYRWIKVDYGGFPWDFLQMSHGFPSQVDASTGSSSAGFAEAPSEFYGGNNGWLYGEFMAILWWIHGNFMAILWWFYGDFMIFMAMFMDIFLFRAPPKRQFSIGFYNSSIFAGPPLMETSI